MLDRGLAELYGVETRVLKQAVKRNVSRFPSDFMFRLSQEEQESLRSQFVTLRTYSKILQAGDLFQHGQDHFFGLIDEDR